MTTLHTVNKFGLTSSALDSCLRVALPGDAILLIEDGVYNVVRASFTRHSESPEPDRLQTGSPARQDLSTIRVYALGEDLQARGIAADSLTAFITPITYADFARLVCEHKKSVSWF